jgi:hypothetical protein
MSHPNNESDNTASVSSHSISQPMTKANNDSAVNNDSADQSATSVSMRLCMAVHMAVQGSAPRKELWLC